MSERLCTVAWCGRPLRCKGLCAGHYSRQLRGLPLGTLGRRPSASSTWEQQAALALASSTELRPGGCLVWTAATDKSGYGRVRVMGQMWRTHRISYALASGVSELPASSVVHHTCGVHGCCAPQHLQLLDGHDANAANGAEMRGRHEYQRRIAELEARVAELEDELEAALAA